ncbi:MAG: response regulator [Spirochaetales bacterium]|nr:response regulator [Spirochaetales bacterium]
MPNNYENTMLKLHKKIWEIASQLELDDFTLIQNILNTIGEELKPSRVCYLQFIDKDLTCTQEWLDTDIHPTKGTKIPDEVVQYLKLMYFHEVTLEKAIKAIPLEEREVLTPIITEFAKKENLKSLALFPLTINNQEIGWFTLDNCNPSPKETILTDAIIEIMDDVVKIIAIHREKKTTEEKLQEINSRLETKVSERTVALTKQNKELIQKDEEISLINKMLETSLEILSHDTRNIFSNLYMILEEMKEKPEYKKLKANIDELFEMTTETAGILKTEKRILSIKEMIESIRIGDLRDYVTTHSRINLNLPKDRDFYIEVTALFKNTIGNILENGLKYSAKSEKIDLTYFYKDNYITFLIEDRGMGIPDEMKARVLEKFYRLPQHISSEGSGRGLWITKNLVEKEGGTINIFDNKDKGTSVEITLPVFDARKLETPYILLSSWFNIPIQDIENKAESIKTVMLLNEEEPLPNIETEIFTRLLAILRKEKATKFPTDLEIRIDKLKKLNKDGVKIMLTDDSLYVHYYLSKFLTEEGYNICGNARNGVEAVHLYKQIDPKIILMDYTMPKMNGIEAAKEIFKINPELKIIFLSAAAEMKSVQESIFSSFPSKNVKIITKPADKATIISKIEELLVASDEE